MEEGGRYYKLTGHYRCDQRRGTTAVEGKGRLFVFLSSEDYKKTTRRQKRRQEGADERMSLKIIQIIHFHLKMNKMTQGKGLLGYIFLLNIHA